MAEEHIKINPVPTKVKYSGNGVVREFPTGFAFFEDDNIVVYHNGIIINTGYSVTGVGETDGGVVTFDVAPAEGDKIVIIRRVAIERVTDFQEGGAFRAKNINDELDRQTAFCQQIQEEIERCVKVEVTDEQTPEELLAEVYGKLDSATDVAQDAIAAANEATIAAEQATTAVEEAKKQVIETQEYVDAAKQEINSTVDEARMELSDTILEAVEDVKREAANAADETVQATIGESVNEAANYARESKTWANGEDAEVEEFAPGENEHSSRGYADLAMAIANTPEDTPVDASNLLALDVIRGPKGDSGEAEFSGDIHFTGSFNVEGDDNHPIKITAMAGTSASGYQVVDSGGLGDSDFEHYATGDRYGTRITNHNNTSDTSVSIDLYQSNAGRSVLDLSDVETILAPALLGAIYPVGSIYITTNATCPIADLGVGTWELVARDRVLQGAGDRGSVGTTIEESLPNITGTLAEFAHGSGSASGTKGAFKTTYTSSNSGTSGSGLGYNSTTFDASRSSSTYQNNAPVQPAAYLVNIFRRIS